MIERLEIPNADDIETGGEATGSRNHGERTGALAEIANRLKLIWRLFSETPSLKLTETDYEAYWKKKRGDQVGKVSAFQRERVRWILPRIQDGASVLDLGCGDGAVLRYLKGKKRIEPIAADISEFALDSLSKAGVRTCRFDLACDDPGTLPLVDHIILFEVLEHLQNPEKLLIEILKRARKSVFVSVPNTGYFPYRLRLLAGRFPVQWRTHPGEHIRYWTVSDFRWWLGELDLIEKSTIDAYQGVPVLNSCFKNLFGMGIIAEVRK